jgi:formate-dependent nitrite reductase membrane component NrfD
MTEITVDRGTHLVAAQAHVWSWDIPVYFFFAGVAAGIMLLTVWLWRRTSLDQRSRWLRWLPFAAPITLALGMLVLFPHLSYKAHAYRFYTTLKPASPMSWEAWILLLSFPATLLLGLSGLLNREIVALSRWAPIRLLRLGGLLRWAHALAQQYAVGVQWSNLVLGLALGAYPGFLLGTLVAHPAWHSAALAPIFLVSALLTGAALMRLFPLNSAEHQALRGINLWAIALQLCLIALFLIWLGTGTEAARQAADLFLGGRFTALFWSLVMLAGLVVPMLLELLEGRRRLSPALASPLLILAGGLFLRLIIVAAG